MRRGPTPPEGGQNPRGQIPNTVGIESEKVKDSRLLKPLSWVGSIPPFGPVPPMRSTEGRFEGCPMSHFAHFSSMFFWLRFRVRVRVPVRPNMSHKELKGACAREAGGGVGSLTVWLQKWMSRRKTSNKLKAKRPKRKNLTVDRGPFRAPAVPPLPA